MVYSEQVKKKKERKKKGKKSAKHVPADPLKLLLLPSLQECSIF